MAGNRVGRVADKVAFITGAARGQGREHAIRLAEEGADIIAVDICKDIDGVGYPGASEADLADTADLVEKSGRRVVTAKADVRDLESLRAALEQGVATLGPIDIVVANAGISGIPAPAALIEQSAWQTMLDINVTGVWHTVKAALPHMTNGGGSIILVSSMLGLRGGGYMATPLVYRGVLYVVTYNGVLTAYDAKTGKKHYTQRVADGTAFTASPVAADGKVYFASEDGRVFVIKADPVYQVVATNEMGESTLATPAFSEGTMFWRTQGHIIAVGG